MNDLLKIATGKLGITEISGSVYSERCLQYAEDIGLIWNLPSHLPIPAGVS